MSQTQAASSKAKESNTEPSPIAQPDADAQKLRESHKTLSENEEWLQKNAGKLVSK
jgi:hypothetical protein